MEKYRQILSSLRQLLLVLLVLCRVPMALGEEQHKLNLDNLRELEIQHMDSSDLFDPQNELKNLDPNQDQERILAVYLFLAWSGNLQIRAKPEEIDRILSWAKDHHRFTEWSMIRTSLTYWGSGTVNLSSLMEKLIAEIRMLNDPQGLAFALVYHSYYLLDNRKNDEAFKILVEANELLKTVAQPSLIVFEQAKAAISLALGYQEKFEAAKAAHLELDAFYEKHGIRSQRSFNLYNLGFIHRNKGGDENLAVAQEFFHKSIKLAESVSSSSIIASNYYALSLVANQQKQHKQAVDYALKAAAFFDKDNNDGWRPHVLKQLAQAYKGDKQFSKALETTDKAAKAFPKDSRTNLNELKFLRYEIYKDMQEWMNAMLQLEQFTEEFRKLAAEKEKEEYQRASVNLGLQFQEEKNQQLKEQVVLLKKFQWMTFAACCLIAMVVGVLVLVWRQRGEIQRSRQKMKEILDNIDEGIMTIDKNLQVMPGYSQYLERIFPVAGQSLVQQPIHDLIFGHEEIASHESILVRESLLACFGEEELTWEFNVPHLPFEIKQDHQILSLHWQPLFNEHKLIRNVLLSVRDITEQRKLEEAMQSESQRIEQLQKKLEEILMQDMTAVKAFMLDFKDNMIRLQNMPPETQLKKLHGWKGAARVLGLKLLASHIHRLEAGPQPYLWQGLDEHIADYLHLLTPTNTMARKTSLMDYAGLYAREMQRLPENGRVVQGLLIDDEVRWQPEALPAVHEMLLHAVSNAIDHGFIRSSSNRAAKISIQSRVLGNTAELTVTDNGAGIDFQHLQKKANDLGLSSQKDLTELLFQDGFTTAAQTTETSGRGVGLSAIRSISKEWGGTTQLDSAPGGGTILRITLPKERSCAA